MQMIVVFKTGTVSSLPAYKSSGSRSAPNLRQNGNPGPPLGYTAPDPGTPRSARRLCRGQGSMQRQSVLVRTRPTTAIEPFFTESILQLTRELRCERRASGAAASPASQSPLPTTNTSWRSHPAPHPAGSQGAHAAGPAYPERAGRAGRHSGCRRRWR